MSRDFRGSKSYRIFIEFLESQLPDNISDLTYIEPFGGTFCIAKNLKVKPKQTIYNDILDYGFDIDADIILNVDYKQVLNNVDIPENVIFYLDPPYFGKEDYYDNDLVVKDKKFHLELFEQLKKLKSKFICSYEDVKFIRDLYENYFIIKKFSDFSDRKILKSEILIKNF